MNQKLTHVYATSGALISCLVDAATQSWTMLIVMLLGRPLTRGLLLIWLLVRKIGRLAGRVIKKVQGELA